MSPPPRLELTPTERGILAAVADVIAPRWKNLPSASDIDLVAEPLDRVLHVRPELIGPLRSSLAGLAASAPSDGLVHLSKENPTQFQALMQVVAGAYYMDQRVRKALGYPGQQRLPPGTWPPAGSA